MVIMHVLTNPILSLQLGILGILWGGMVSGGNYKLGTGISYVTPPAPVCVWSMALAMTAY